MLVSKLCCSPHALYCTCGPYTDCTDGIDAPKAVLCSSLQWALPVDCACYGGVLLGQWAHSTWIMRAGVPLLQQASCCTATRPTSAPKAECLPVRGCVSFAGSPGCQPGGCIYCLSVCLSVRLSVSVSLLPARLLYSTVPLQLCLPICLPFAKLLISSP